MRHPRFRALLGSLSLALSFGVRLGLCAGALGLAGSTAWALTPDGANGSARVAATVPTSLLPTAMPVGTATLTPFAETGSPTTGRPQQLKAHGYIEQEWRVRGKAQAYEPKGEWNKTQGPWPIQPRGAAQPYETRLLVRRPADPARFNGIVVVEWMNVSLLFDLDGAYLLARDEILREGYAWVGISVEDNNVKALKNSDGARYAGLNIANTGLSYDIFTQAAKAVRKMASESWGLPGKTPGASAQALRMLAMGYSQSGSYFITYINAIQPVMHTFDGFFVASTANVAMTLDDDPSRIVGPDYRPERDAPVIQISNEMETKVGWRLSGTPDGDALRHWEIPGASHLDRYMQQEALPVTPKSAALSMPHCLKPTNILPSRVFHQAALHALRMWVTAGTPPPIAPRMARGDWGFTRYDDIGNAMGGLRLPDLDLPLYQYGMYSNTTLWPISLWSLYACMAGGSANPLDAQTLRKLYPKGQEAYYEAYKQKADKLLSEGFIRPGGHAMLLEQARKVKLPR